MLEEWMVDEFVFLPDGWQTCKSTCESEQYDEFIEVTHTMGEIEECR